MNVEVFFLFLNYFTHNSSFPLFLRMKVVLCHYKKNSFSSFFFSSFTKERKYKEVIWKIESFTIFRTCRLDENIQQKWQPV